MGTVVVQLAVPQTSNRRFDWVSSKLTIILSIEPGIGVTKEQIWLSQEESSSRFDYIAKKTAYYSLAVLNGSKNRTQATVRIKSCLRPASLRTYFEGAVRRVVGFVASTEAFITRL